MRTSEVHAAVGFIALTTAAVACSDVASARPQLLVVVDTDAHVVGELSSKADVSPDAAIDTLRIDVLDDQNNQIDVRTFLVADPLSWPVSFGIEPSASAGEVRVWIRAFRALFATTGTAADGTATLDPVPQVTIDRLVAVSFPSSGVQYVGVTLQTDCMGTPSSFGAPLATCLSAGELSGDPHTGLTTSTTAPAQGSSVDSWAPAIAAPCNATPSSGQVCIPGGFFIMGDLDAVGFGVTTDYETVPIHPAIVSPFLLDTYEFTVGKFRALVASGAFTTKDGPMPTMPSEGDAEYCTWLGPGNAANDELPLNCVPYQTSAALCAMQTGGAGHGALPTEAQWEYAARGRGQRLEYPWGDVEPQCCSASLNRAPVPDPAAGCPGSGVEPVGSHPLSSSCGGTGDVSRDGVFDLAGSVSEVLADDEQSYTGSCWATPGIPQDPTCQASGASQGMRGAYWNAGLGAAYLPLRDVAAADGEPSAGFRCAYPDRSP
jgi:formylglycine-generating enzyme required for sulfatase activity